VHAEHITSKGTQALVTERGKPFRDYANDSELRLAVGQKLLNLVADGVTDPGRLRQLTVESLFLPGH
jgi:hypothetical protein